MKNAFFITGLAALCILTACQGEEVNVKEQQAIKLNAGDVPARYTIYQEKYEEALAHVVMLERELQSDEIEELKAHYGQRVTIWKDYMNELLGELKISTSEEQWAQIFAQQERWYPQMETVSNEAAANARSNMEIIAYLEKKEDAMQIRARYLLDEYYFKRQLP
ncbi:MAG: hypothetical protein UHX00_10345 [Caryophanon sp.]|uniref:Lysozyme inhibitor LprI N-terminal domain-containing protein n=1 Tax=Caryophanon latum TaxID=33977 RepID=A0A1C0YVB4_9BACL|nr:hypothetical protein [Caryophanon latum]MEE1132004.1 hypothetical protein [Caryophanon sp.]OCS91115.1 hypothetical protein A6K76_10245 [Caryophanon latum]